jgi:cephalosporin hydroxylase
MDIYNKNEVSRVQIGEAVLPLTEFATAFQTLLIMHTSNFDNVRWLGVPVWQDVLSLWTIQETIAEIRPSLIIETGTNRGGSALFYASLCELMGKGSVVTIDIEKMHDLSHPRIEWLIGSSLAPEIVARVAARVDDSEGPVMVILDSDHSQSHVTGELERYSPFVTPGSYLLVQDGIIDALPMFADGRPGPLPALEQFVQHHPNFEVDDVRCQRFIVTHHPRGWLRRVR